MIKAKKSFGQNFLQDQSVIFHILNHFAATKDEHVVEIGPGQGALTKHLTKANLDVIELDLDMCKILQQELQDQINIHNCDAGTVDYSKIYKTKTLRLIGNLPYNSATKIITNALEQYQVIQDCLFMVQKEVANRLTAEVGERSYGRLSVFVKLFAEIEQILTVSPSSFQPAPKVMSEVIAIKIKPHPSLHHLDISNFSEFLKLCFAMKRKTLANNLKNKVQDVQAILLKSKISNKARAEELSVEQFIELYKLWQDTL